MSRLSLEVAGRTFAIDSFNVHRLVIAGVTVASKFFSGECSLSLSFVSYFALLWKEEGRRFGLSSCLVALTLVSLSLPLFPLLSPTYSFHGTSPDVFYTNSRYAKVGGLPQSELNQLELQFLLLNDFRLVIPLEEMQRYGDQLLLYSEGGAAAGGEAIDKLVEGRRRKAREEHEANEAEGEKVVEGEGGKMDGVETVAGGVVEERKESGGVLGLEKNEAARASREFRLSFLRSFVRSRRDGTRAHLLSFFRFAL